MVSQRGWGAIDGTWLSDKPWTALIISILIVMVASVIRAAVFSELGRGIPYLTYYPAVAIAAIVGGLPAGLLATVLSAVLAHFWIQQGQLTSVEWLAMSFFVVICGMISVMAT